MLLKLLRLHLQSDPPAAPVLKVLLSAAPARPRPAQGGLFQPISPDPEKLELTVARLASLVGDSNIGSPELVDTHRPGEFRIGRLLSSLLEDRIRSGDTPVSKGPFAPEERNSFTAFRIFRPPLPAKVDLHQGRPACVSFNALCGSVIAASGPWRTSGDWWREDTWQRDEWDLELRFESFSMTTTGPQRGVYCIYFDSLRQSWFVRGIYD
jgi:protein ImuB